MIDIHTHLHFKDYDADRAAVITRAREVGVEKMILVGTDLESSRAAVELAEKHDFLYASVGVHPHEFNEGILVCHSREGGNPEEKSGSRVKPGMTEGGSQEWEWIADLRELAKHPKVVAIGECGLDYFSRDPGKPISDEQKAVQLEGFLAQLEIAKESGLPMIIHTRPSVGTMPASNDSQAKRSDSGGDAYEDVFEILEADEVRKLTKLKAVLHCYQGDTEITRKFLSLPNIYFSFAGNVTYPVKKALAGSKDDILETVKLVPMERLFVETDCPYLAPQEHRGIRNEPSYVQLTAAKVAKVKNIAIEELGSSAERSFQAVFGRSH